MITKIITKTNKYEESDLEFITVEENELKIFIALNILMSLLTKPKIQSCWSANKIIETRFFKYIMSCNQIISIFKNLLFNRKDNHNDALTKIREVTKRLKTTFINKYVQRNSLLLINY